MQRYPTNIDYISHDYKVVITPYSYHHIIMKLINLCLDSMNTPSPMSKGVVEIRINSQPCKGINLTTCHTQAQRHHEWQQFTMHSTGWARSYLTLVLSSTHMPQWTQHGWPEHYPIIHP
jgi:hypothetical protein